MFYKFLFVFKLLFFISININAGLFDDVNKALNQVTENLSNETKTNKNTNSMNDTEPAKDLPSSADVLFLTPLSMEPITRIHKGGMTTHF